MKTITHGTLFLARATDWAHTDGTAPVRVHVAIADTDENGIVWAIRGTTQWHTEETAVRATPDKENRLLRTTYFVTKDPAALVALRADQAGRTTGRIGANAFNRIWDQIEAKA